MATNTTLNKSGLFSAFGLQLPFYFFKETTTHYLLLQIRHLSVAPCLPERIPIIATSYSPLQQELSVFFHFIIYFIDSWATAVFLFHSINSKGFLDGLARFLFWLTGFYRSGEGSLGPLFNKELEQVIFTKEVQIFNKCEKYQTIKDDI